MDLNKELWKRRSQCKKTGLRHNMFNIYLTWYHHHSKVKFSLNPARLLIFKSVPCYGAAGLNDHGCRQRGRGCGSRRGCGGHAQQVRGTSAAQSAVVPPFYATVARSPLQSRTVKHAKRPSATVKRAVAAHIGMEFAESAVNDNTAAESYTSVTSRISTIRVVGFRGSIISSALDASTKDGTDILSRLLCPYPTQFCL